MWWAITAIVIALCVTAITRWALSASVDFAKKPPEEERMKVRAPIGLTKEEPRWTREDLILSGQFGPTGCPGFLNKENEPRYVELVGAADKLERDAYRHGLDGHIATAHHNIQQAGELRVRAQRILDIDKAGEEYPAAREVELDDKVEEILDVMKTIR